jgi:voltage-gated potassium channel
MAAHTVLIGYGATGRSAASVLHADQTRLVVVDTDQARSALAAHDGARFVQGDGSDLAALHRADAAHATQMVVAVPDDATAVRITSLARSLNRTATITTLLRRPRWRALAGYLRADHTVVSGELVGRLLGMSVVRPETHEQVRRALCEAPNVVVAQREARANEVGRDPRACGPLVLAVLRDGVRRWTDDPMLSPLRRGDRLLVLQIPVHHTADGAEPPA